LKLIEKVNLIGEFFESMFVRLSYRNGSDKFNACFDLHSTFLITKEGMMLNSFIAGEFEFMASKQTGSTISEILNEKFKKWAAATFFSLLLFDRKNTF